MNIRLNVRMIALALALLLVAFLLVGIAALHAAHSVPWHILAFVPQVPGHHTTLALSPDVFSHGH
jgi:hypothetical protein